MMMKTNCLIAAFAMAMAALPGAHAAQVMVKGTMTATDARNGNRNESPTSVIPLVTATFSFVYDDSIVRVGNGGVQTPDFVLVLKIGDVEVTEDEALLEVVNTETDFFFRFGGVAPLNSPNALGTVLTDQTDFVFSFLESDATEGFLQFGLGDGHGLYRAGRPFLSETTYAVDITQSPVEPIPLPGALSLMAAGLLLLRRQAR